ncbi:MAG: pyridoxal phosphate-dependent aminotransferase [Flavobacteriales bacterium]|nr:pyridoxal phosphate-dependent aminotransferase [Flavobacteriales bacterium]MDG2245929.1 pyridoxal phosphate-dependent aminotransferase [Flavobacteriales bacterium]
MQETSDLLSRLSESATLAMARISRELKAKGLDVISLSLGEPDFNTPDFVKDAAKKAIDENYSHYPPVNGYAEVREAISNKFKRDNNLDYSADQIVLSTGAKQSIANVVLSLVNPGDEVILPAPYWVSYSEVVKVAGGIPVSITTRIEDDFKLTASQLEAAITPKTRLMIYSSPCNPSGSVYTQSELESLAAVLRQHENVLVVSDEIYELINFTDAHASLGTIDGMYDRTITVNGVSKGFAMTGWRLGYIGAPLWIAKACSKIQGQFTSAPCGISQMAAKAAVEADPAVTHDMKQAFLARRDMMIAGLRAIDGLKVNVPTGAFYIFPDASSFFGKSDGTTTVNNASELCNYLLEKEHVALVTGEAFGDPNCFRISYAASEDELKKALVRIKRALDELV